MNTKANKEIPTELLKDFSAYLDKYLGLYYPNHAWEGIRKKIPEIASSFGYRDPISWLRVVLTEPVNDERINGIAHHLTIGETYFFRDPDSLGYMRHEILEPLIRERHHTTKHLKIWSSACCTGEEPYSLAMIINESILNRAEWDISILGTDINTKFLADANRGIYRDWALRSIDPNTKERYFTYHDRLYLLSPEIQNLVKFNYLNLVEDKYPSLMNGTAGNDLILCNNVLIYFSEEQIKNVIDHLSNCLVEGGHLCVSAVEAALVNHPRLKVVSRGRSNIFRKETMVRLNLPLNLTPSKKTPVNITPTNYVHKKAEPTVLKAVPVQKAYSSFVITPSELEKGVKDYAEGGYDAIIGTFEPLIAHIKTEKGFPGCNLEALKLLIRASANLGHLDKSLEWCALGLSYEQVDPILHYLHAAILQELSRPEEAVQALKKALFLNSEFTIAYFTLGNILIALNNIAQAKKNFENALTTIRNANPQDIVPEGEGLTVDRLRQIIRHMMERL